MVTDIRVDRGPNYISRENVQRKTVVSANAGDRDLGSVVDDIRASLDASLDLPEGYFIQIGAFKNRDSAYAMAEELKDLGFPAQVFDPSSTETNPLFKVRVGGYETRAQAEAELEKVANAQGKQKSDYFIWRR